LNAIRDQNNESNAEHISNDVTIEYTIYTIAVKDLPLVVVLYNYTEKLNFYKWVSGLRCFTALLIVILPTNEVLINFYELLI